MNLKGRSFLTLLDYSPEEIEGLLNLAADLKAKKKAGIPHRLHEGKNIALIFEKTSTRTRCSFEVAASDLGMHPVYLDPKSSQLGKKESIADTARVLGRMFDGIEYRGFEQTRVEKLAQYSGVPVWNGLTNEFHPTQILADFLTIREHFGHLDGLKVAIVGDLAHSRVCGSLAPALKTMGADVTLVAPPTFQVGDPSWYGCSQTNHLDDVIEDMDVVYMLRVQLERMEGAAIPSRREYNRLYGLSLEREARMKPEAIICHPGPMNRGMEIDAEVADCARSRILDQVTAGVATRMAEMYLLLGGERNGISD